MLISIVMPCYNASSTIYDSIGSVLLQTYKNWELIVVDDRSTDNSRDIILSIKDERIRFISSQVNSGSPATPRNIAIKESRGEYIAFLDSDDLWTPTKLERQVEFMIKNNYKFTCTAYNIIDPDGNFISSYVPPKYVIYSDLLFNNSIGCLTAMIHRSLVDNEKFPVCGHEDYALWLKLIKVSDGVHALSEKLASYRLMNGSVSSNKLKLISFFWSIYRHQEKFGLIKSFYCCVRYFMNVVFFKYK
ncbi:glycosyltransferase family 2 protein [Vibrio vulnificus]|uniref:glycosyltransferase family 2 protein n=1 Tax=Vibrio vulnificus TaxID=672 RepID=UPI001023DBCE|nr:glycosyltransferase family 2 protein [Vibrio vulnificus]RZQ27561.1 glycosyltransferase family 2 protein [Vibrio vulnificus]